MNEAWLVYPELRDRVIALARSLGPEALARTVPLTDEWTVADVIAHVCGLNADVVAGGREGLGSDERTAAQVSSRAGMTIAEVCDEWLGYDRAMQLILAEIPLMEERLAADLVIHLHDVQHALGLPIDEADAATISAAHVYAMRSPDRWAGSADVDVVVELTDGYRAGVDDGNADITLRASPYDFLRSVAGRRSRSQVEALDWSGDAGAVLDNFSPYAELGDVDAAV
jgi:hypothetical protein